MICEACQSTGATVHVTERLPSGQFVEAHYCQVCSEGKGHRTSTDVNGFPLPKLALKHIMKIVAVFAISNCLTVWVMRSRPIHQTPEQLMKGTGFALLMVNSCIGLAASYVFLKHWLRRVIWYKRTGGIKAMPKGGGKPRIPSLTGFSMLWVVVSNLLTACLAALLLPYQRFNLLLYVSVSSLLGIGFLGIVWNVSATRPLLMHFWQDWRRASAAERALGTAAFSWPMCVNILLQCKLIPLRLIRGINPWVWLPGLLAIALGFHLMFIMCELLSTNRRSWANATEVESANG